MRSLANCFLYVFIVLLSVACKSAKKNTPEPFAVQLEIAFNLLEINVNREYRWNPESVPFEIVKAEVVGNQLNMLVEYGGGCEEHEFTVHTSGAYMKSLPPKLNLWIEHDDKQDACRALVQKEFSINLEKIQFAGSQELVLILNNREDIDLRYKY
ncbi:MAG TPA: hypothetical protein VIK71_04125 [Flavobacteriales bacterium]